MYITQTWGRRVHRKTPTDISPNYWQEISNINIYFVIYVFVLDICYQHQLSVLEIYPINNWWIHVSWRVSVRPWDAGLGNVHLTHDIFVLDMNVWTLKLGDDYLRWWTSEFCNGVMNVWGDERLNSVKGWWTSKVMNVWGDECLRWWTSEVMNVWF